MKVLLINPCYKYNFGRYQGGTINTIHAPPLGLLYISSYLEEVGIPNSIIDMTYEDIQPIDLKNYLIKNKPDIVGISAGMAFNITSSLEIAKIIKGISQDIKIVFGGIHSTFTYKELLSQNDCIDFVVLFEGELTMAELCRAIESNQNLSKINGIAYKNKNGDIIATEVREKIENLDSLPMPARYKIPFLDYPENTRGFMVTSRGCPFSCAFCSTSAFNGTKIRYHSVDRVIQEIKELKYRYNVDTIVFGDDTFTMDRQRTIEICEGILKEGLNIKWGCDTRADLVDQELLNIMVKAGCYTIFFGIEAVGNDSLKSIGKKLTIEQIKQAIEWTKNAGCQVIESFIIGLPYQTYDEIHKISKFIRETNPNEILFNMMIIYPGTRMYTEPEKFGIKWMNYDWSKSEQTTPMLETEWMSPEDMRKAYVLLMINIEKGFT